MHRPNRGLFLESRGGGPPHGKANKMRAAPVPGHAVPFASEHPATTEGGLRLAGAAFQILATVAIVRALHPDAVGVYFRGFVIALGAAALLRAKYELYIAHHIIGGRSVITEVSDGVLLMQLARRVLMRATLVCAALLVLATDIDIQAPRYEPVLETYLPFVLAIPGISLSTFIGEAMRAANRTLFGTIISAYAVNLFILITILLAPHAPLVLYAWAFFGGSLVAAALAVVLGRLALPGNWEETKRPVCRQALKEADEREVIGIGRAALLWGPLCILAVSTTAVQMAEYAVAYRTAMIVDFFLPALNLSGYRDVLRGRTYAESLPMHVQLRGAVLVSSAFVAALLIAAPVTLRLYGYPYNTLLATYALLLVMQWANSVGRPAVRHAVIEWDAPQIRAAVGAGALAALIVCAAAIGMFGALAAAAATLLGALVLNLWAIVSGLRAPQRASRSV